MEYLPTPGVMYSSVKVKERIKRVSDPQPRELPGYIEYKFRAPSLLSVLNVTGDLKRNAHHGRNINATYDGFEVSLTGKTNRGQRLHLPDRRTLEYNPHEP